MKKINKYIYISMIVFILTLAYAPSEVLAHSITEWAEMYDQDNAGGNFQFAIGDKHHIDGDIVYYYWANYTVGEYFGGSLNNGVNAWGGMIKAVETTSDKAHVKITYDPDIVPDKSAAFVRRKNSSGHFMPGITMTEMVLGNIKSYNVEQKKLVFAHELGHLWGIDDLYTVGKDELESIYSQPYSFNGPTRHDTNAMYIGLNNPWFENWDGMWYQKSPGVWANNEWLTIDGRDYYFLNGIKTTAYKIYYNANGGSGAPTYQTKIHGTDLTLESNPSGAKKYTLAFHSNGGSVSLTSKTVNCTFKNWNTNSSGTGTTYSSSSTYTTNAAATLYAQWYNPKAGELPIPTRSGYLFKGWYTEPGGDVEVTDSSIISNNMILYAEWIPLTTMSLNTMFTSNVSQGGEEIYYIFKPTTSGVYKLYSEGDEDTCVNLYTDTNYQLAQDDDGGENYNFSLIYWLKAGQTYYIKTKLYSEESTGSFNVRMESSSVTTYTITYNGNASGVVGVPDADRKVLGVSMTLPEDYPSREGYVFLGWSTTNTSKVPTYYMTNNKFNATFTTNANITLYAIWGVLGDVNMDGTVSLEDSQLALKYYLGIETLNVHQKKLMDYNGDGILDMKDAQLIQQKALNII